MRIKTALRYQFIGYKKPILIFYLILTLVYTFLFISRKIYVSAIAQSGDASIVTASLSGIEISTIIFLFVAGLNSFTENFKMFLQNSLSRKTLVTSFTTIALCIGLVMGLIQSLLSLLLSGAEANNTLFMKIYNSRYVGFSSDLSPFIEGFLWHSIIYTSVLLFGFLITSLYYRLNKSGKYIVSIGVPAFFLILLPAIDATLTGGRISDLFSKFASYSLGLSNGFNPYYAVINFALLSIVWGTLSYLLAKKAVIKGN